MGHITEQLRGSCPFSYGNTINFGERISSDSPLTTFVVFAPAVVDRDDCRNDVSIPRHKGHDVIHLAGMYPIHKVERQYIAAHDLKSFWDLDWDPYAVARGPAV